MRSTPPQEMTLRAIPQSSLVLGHVGDARNFRALFASGIVALVDLALNEPALAVPRELIYCRFPLIDGDGNPPWLLRQAIATVSDLARAEIPTLVFCSNGLSRSVVIVTAALAVVLQEPLARSLERIAPEGPADVSPAFQSSVYRAMHPDAVNDFTLRLPDPRG